MLKVKKNPCVGDLIQFPLYEFAPMRKGWNGWIFRCGEIISIRRGPKTGKLICKIVYCSKIAGRYKMFPHIETTKEVYIDQVFEYNYVKLEQSFYDENKDLENVCWNEDMAFLVNHKYVK